MFLTKSNVEILAELDKLVYGHTEAKKALITLVNRSKLKHYQIYNSPTVPKDDELISNTNCLLIGASGTGKTHLVRSLSKVCNFPLVCIDANKLAPTNAQDGFNEERLVRQIIKLATNLCKHEPDKYYSTEGTMAQTVVFIDEIDKLSTCFESTGNWNKHVQANFLKIFENSADLKHISFIFAGAFSDMKVRPDKTKASIGFNSSNVNSDNDFDIEEEVIKYGLIPELVGRIHNIIVLDKLEQTDFEKILNTMILPKIQKELKSLHIKDFNLTTDQIDTICAKAVKSKLGVRVLTKEIQKLSQELEFNYDSHKRRQDLLK